MIEQLRKVRLVLLLLTLSVTAFAQDVVVNGRATSELDGTPLPGVSVLEKGTSNGTSTDSDGNYTLRTQANATLVFSFIGFATQEIEVGSRTTVNAALVEDITQLGEVVVTALGIKKEQKALGYSVSTVNADQLTQSGTTNFATALYGKAAGLKVTTAPGGSGSAVNVQIRGINSLNYNQQPLYIVDGIVIRNDGQNGAAGANNNNFFEDQRIRGNGILDINPTDIESVSILKGASASALYGSDAASGVIVITTKKGSKKDGLGVDVNYTGTVEEAAFLPKFQNVYGPGYERQINIASGALADGWVVEPNSPTGYRPLFRAWAQFGPKMEGQEVMWWDGSIRPYKAQPDNYKDVFDKGYSSNLNVALSNQTDKVNYRLSATHLDYKGTNPGSKQQKNTFSLNSTVKLHEKVSADIVVSYINTQTHNRAYQFGPVLAGFDGFFSRAEDMDLLRKKFQTSDGYKYATDNSVRPERFLYYLRPVSLLDVFWNQLKNKYDETENRLLTSATLNWDVVNHFKLRGRIGSDYTGLNIEDKRHNEYPVAYNEVARSTGLYAVSKGAYSILYGDLMATYSNTLGSDIEYSVSAGFQSRTEDYKDQVSSTTDGLVSENWFSISNSYGIASGTSTRKELLKYAYLGILNASYKNIVFLEATARQEYSSTLPPENNNYFYASGNGSFVFSDAFELPSALSFGKVRASYGIVGNSPPMYVSNVAYKQSSLQTINGSVPARWSAGTYGNNQISAETKYEAEFGLETRFFNDRFGIDVSYYTNRVEDQIMELSIAPSNGAGKQVVNVGEIGSKGLEIALNATPIDGVVRWDTRLNAAFNESKVNALAEGVNEINFYNADEGSLKLVATAGETLGNIYMHPRATDENGNFIINASGLYVIDKTKFEKAGNIMPKVIGGLTNTVSYKNFSLDFTIDYRFGGQIISTPLKYGTSAGLYENTLKYRDEEHGGLTYTEGGVTYHDGVLLDGVTESGESNTKIISAADYYRNTFRWGANFWNDKAVYDNSYIKMREVALTYKIPAELTDKLHLRNVRFSLLGRNLFYIWRTLENLDPEAPIGNKWWSQGVDVGSSAATRSYGFSLSASF